jgi:hypothetical protein
MLVIKNGLKIIELIDYRVIPIVECYEYALRYYRPGDTLFILKVPLMRGQLSPGGHVALIKKNGTLIEHIPGDKTYIGKPERWSRKDLFGRRIDFFEAFEPATEQEVVDLQKKCSLG